MAIITDIYMEGTYWVMVEPVGKAANYYENLGYKIHKERNKWGKLTSPRGSKLLVKVDDLMSSSPALITKICDYCENHLSKQQYCHVMRNRLNTDGKDRCKECARKFALLNREKNRALKENMWITNPKLANLLSNPEVGYEYSQSSNYKVDWKCNTCENIIKNKAICDVKAQGLYCPRCSDGVSYPEKFFTSVLVQLDVDFEFQKTFDWSGKKRYDFYIPDHNCLIETHGMQHYVETFATKGGRSLKEEKENDSIKYSLSQINGISHYVVLNCSNSEMNFIKYNILQSELINIFDLDIIDWTKCHEYACSSLVLEACELWISRKTIKEISTFMKLSDVTIRTYLKAGASIGWCDYDPKEERQKAYRKMGKGRERSIVRLTKDGAYLDAFNSMSDAVKKFPVSITSLVDTCKGKHKTAGGFKWMYKEDYEKTM